MTKKLAGIFTVLYFVWILGFFFHTLEPVSVLGKYSKRYLLILAFLVLLTPCIYYIAEFLFSSFKIKLCRKYDLQVIPVIWLLGAFGVVVLFSGIFIGLPSVPKSAFLEEYHPYLLMQPPKNDEKIHINRWGFRGNDISKEKPTGTFRIFMLGGSTVYCKRSAFEDSHPRVLEKILRKEFPDRKIEVQNAGLDWHTSQASLIKLLTTVQAFEPDMIILWHAINDMYRSFTMDEFSYGQYQADYSHFYGPIRGMINAYLSNMGSRYTLSPPLITRLSKQIGRSWFTDFKKKPSKDRVKVDDKDFKSLPSFRRNMTNIAQIAKSKNIKVILCSQPNMYKLVLSDLEEKKLRFYKQTMWVDGKLLEHESLVRGMSLYNETARAVAVENDVPFVDLAAVIPKDLDYFIDDVHYSKKGNQLVAETLAEFIIANGLMVDLSPRCHSEPAEQAGEESPEILHLRLLRKYCIGTAF